MGGPGRCGHGGRWCAGRGRRCWAGGATGIWDGRPPSTAAGWRATLIAAAVIILARQTNNTAARGIGDTLLLTGCVPAALGAAAVVPGPVGAPHAALGLAALVSAAVLVVRFTGRHIALGTAVVIAAAAGVVIGLVRMTLVTSGADPAYGAAAGVGGGYACDPDDGAGGRGHPAAGVPVGVGTVDL